MQASRLASTCASPTTHPLLTKAGRQTDHGPAERQSYRQKDCERGHAVSQIYGQAGTLTGSQPDRQRDRPADSQTDKWEDGPTDGQTSTL